MVSLLYTVSDLVFALVLWIILQETSKQKEPQSAQDAAFLRLIRWVIFFCLQDAVWGVSASGLFKADWPLFLSSTVFHLSTVLTTFFWLYYIMAFLSDRLRHPKWYLAIDGLVIAVQVCLVVGNLFTPLIFYVEAGQYLVASLRPLAFFNQYVVYLAISVLMGFYAMRAKKAQRDKFFSVFVFSLAPVLSGAFQLMFPDGPFYSMGYFLGCFIIHIYVLSKDHETLRQLKAEKAMEAEKVRSKTDALTGLSNRRSYEELMMLYPQCPDDENLVYLVADINGLKTLNDTAGHDAGDALIRASASCLCKCFSPYGTVYRLGGDEFAAVLSVVEDDVPALLHTFDEEMEHWHWGEHDGLSMSYGAVVKRQLGNVSFREMAKVADQRMYAAKEAYYSRMGFDRRAMQTAYTALCASYTKILKINITQDTFKIIKMDIAEQTIEKGYAETISAWLRNFGMTGQVMEEDLPGYLEKTDLAFMNHFFENEKGNLNIFYHRRTGDGFRMTKMEMIAAEDFCVENKSLYLYVKDIENSAI